MDAQEIIIYQIGFFLWVGCIIKFSSRHGIRADRKRGRHSETSPKDPPMGGAFWETPISKHIFPNFGSIIPNHLNISKTQILGALQSLTASVLLNLYTNFYPDWKKILSYEQKSICPYMDKRTKFGRFQPINWSSINENSFIINVINRIYVRRGPNTVVWTYIVTSIYSRPPNPTQTPPKPSFFQKNSFKSPKNSKNRVCLQ